MERTLYAKDDDDDDDDEEEVKNPWPRRRRCRPSSSVFLLKSR